MTDKEKIESLLVLLEKAERLVSEFRGGYSNEFFSAEEFHNALTESIKKLKAGDVEEISNLISWFAPTCDWDDFTRTEGIDLGNSIYQLLYELKQSLRLHGIVELIFDYQAAVAEVMSAFEKKFHRRNLLEAYRHDKIIPQTGSIAEHGIKNYSFHGSGLQATFSNGKSIDFDFAFLPDQRSDGFDLWRLNEFVSERTDKFRKYADKSNLEKDFNDLIQRGSIIKPEVAPSTSLYFFRGSLEKKRTNRAQKPWWKIWN